MMRDHLILEERVLTIQEALCEFYYDETNIDNSKYNDICKKNCCILYVIKYMYICVCKHI